jgi:hypothetical protein
LRRHGLANREFGGGEVALHLDVRNVKGIADFIEEMSFGIFREEIFYLEVWK